MRLVTSPYNTNLSLKHSNNHGVDLEATITPICSECLGEKSFGLVIQTIPDHSDSMLAQVNMTKEEMRDFSTKLYKLVTLSEVP